MRKGRPKGSKNKPKVPPIPSVEVDDYFSRISEIGKGQNILSNWNANKGEYQSRMYGSFNDTLRVIEPDGAISLQGPDIIKSTDKKNIRTLTDGRRFDCAGWPV